MSDEVHQAQINIDLDKLIELVHVGARRASSFMFLGSEAAEKIKLSSVKPPSLLSYQFLPEPLPQELSAQIGAEFKVWIAGCALREIEQHFSFFLDRVGEVLTVAEIHGTRVHSSFDLRNKKFELKNAADKFVAVSSRLALPATAEKRLRSLVAARNILTHRLGYVPADYADESGEVVVSWLGTEIFLEGNGQQIVVPVESLESFESPDFETQMFLKFVEKSKTFRVGDKLELSPFELTEICQFYIGCSASIIDGLKALAAAKGALVVRDESAPANAEVGADRDPFR